jgi:hypothetical protein
VAPPAAPATPPSAVGSAGVGPVATSRTARD